MVANSVASAYLVLSLAPSIFHIVRSRAQGTRIILILLDTVLNTKTRLIKFQLVSDFFFIKAPLKVGTTFWLLKFE